MSSPSLTPLRIAFRRAAALLLFASLPACTAIGSAMSPYSEKFSCKNSDHGQCIHPDRAYADAIAGRTSKSEPGVTSDARMLDKTVDRSSARGKAGTQLPYLGYRNSVYRELQGLVEAPVTPMLRPGRTIRTLILPYADRARPDRLYMPRYVYAILDKPQWVVGDYLVNPLTPAAHVPILEQSREKPSLTHENDIPAPPQEQGQ